MLDDKQKTDEKIEVIRAENEKMFAEFIEGEGKIPHFLSVFIESNYGTGTPFEEYLDSIWKTVDSLRNESGYKIWYQLDSNTEINDAAKEICEWSMRRQKMNELLSERSNVDHVHFMPPFDYFWDKTMMIVLSNKEQYDGITEETVMMCKETGISFCVVLSDRELYDLSEGKKKEISYYTYPNYHDETYGDWFFC